MTNWLIDVWSKKKRDAFDIKRRKMMFKELSRKEYKKIMFEEQAPVPEGIKGINVKQFKHDAELLRQGKLGEFLVGFFKGPVK